MVTRYEYRMQMLNIHRVIKQFHKQIPGQICRHIGQKKRTSDMQHYSQHIFWSRSHTPWSQSRGIMVALKSQTVLSCLDPVSSFQVFSYPPIYLIYLRLNICTLETGSRPDKTVLSCLQLCSQHR